VRRPSRSGCAVRCSILLVIWPITKEVCVCVCVFFCVKSKE
jgi:hypothetical protein